MAKPLTVSSTEKSSSAATDDEVLATLTAYNLAVGKVSRTVRHLLPQHHGYECKEPEPGKFTLAFRCLHIWVATLRIEDSGACNAADAVLSGQQPRAEVPGPLQSWPWVPGGEAAASCGLLWCRLGTMSIPWRCLLEGPTSCVHGPERDVACCM